VPKIFRVALDTPLRRLFDYLPPAQGTIPLSVGARVRVPFGRQRRIGIIAAVAETSQVPVARLKPILEVLCSSCSAGEQSITTTPSGKPSRAHYPVRFALAPRARRERRGGS